MTQRIHDPKLSGEIVINGQILTSTAEQIDAKVAEQGGGGGSGLGQDIILASSFASGGTLAMGGAQGDGAEYNGRVIGLDIAAGVNANLPTANTANIGWTCKFVVITTVTSNQYDVTAAFLSDAEFIGSLRLIDTDTSDTATYQAALDADNFDQIRMNGTTTGGVIGDWVEVTIIAENTYLVTGELKHTGNVGTPMSDSGIAAFGGGFG